MRAAAALCAALLVGCASAPQQVPQTSQEGVESAAAVGRVSALSQVLRLLYRLVSNTTINVDVN